MSVVNAAVTALSTDEKRLVSVAPVAERLVVEALVSVAFVAVRLVALSVVTIASVSVEEAATRRVIYASVLVERVRSASESVEDATTSEVMYARVVVAFVVVAFTAAKNVEVALARTAFVEYRFVAVNPVEDAVESVVCPVTSSVPVAVTFPPIDALPTTVRAWLGVDEPIPTRPFASITVRLVPALFFTSRRLVVPCPAPACTVSVVVPVIGVSFCTLKLMLDSKRLVVAFHRRSAFGVTSPRKKMRDTSSASDEALSELILKVLLDVPEMVVEAAEIVFTFMLSA